MTTVFRAHLLLGDAIYACATISRYMREHPEERVIIECLDEYPKEVYQWIPGNPELTFQTDTECDQRYTFDMQAAMELACRSKKSIWWAMGDLCGLPVDPVPVLNIPSMEIPKDWENAYTISPFSRSCSSHQGLPPNKIISGQSWTPMLRFLRRRGKVLLVGGKDEQMPEVYFDESECVSGYPLALVASVFRAAKCVLVLDSGLARLAALLNVPTVVLFPSFLPTEVFAPMWSPSVRIVQIDANINAPNFAVNLKYILQNYVGVI